MTKQTKSHYENNPFYIGLNGLKQLFNNAQSVAIYAIILSIALFILNIATTVIDVIYNPTDYGLPESSISRSATEAPALPKDPSEVIVVAIMGVTVVFALIVISLWLYGVLDYTAAKLASNKKVGLKVAFKAVGHELASYVWLMTLIVIKIALWSLLLIIPGIIMAIRYSLASTVFFAEGKRGDAAIKRSLELTKGAWFTTFAASGLWNLITFSAIPYLIQPGVNAVLYRQLRDATDAHQPKPAAHWLSWLSFFVPIVLIICLITLVALIALAVAVSYT